MNNNQTFSGNTDVAPTNAVENVLASSQSLSKSRKASGSVANMQATLDALMDTTVEIIQLDKNDINNALHFNPNELIHNTSTGIFELTAEQISQLQTHPFLGIIPTMSNAESGLLLENIKANGFIDPITITRNMEIIDGRARVALYNNEHIISSPTFVYYDGNENSILDYIVSKNLMRRHLNQGQIAVSALKLYEITKTRNQEDMNKTLPTVENQNDVVVNQKSKMNSRDQVAKCLGVSSSYIGKASKISSYDKELLQKVFQNEISLEEAYSSCSGKKNEGNNSSTLKTALNPIEEYESQYEPIGTVAHKSILLLITLGVKELDAQKFILAKIGSEKKRKVDWELKGDEEKYQTYLADFKEFMKRISPDNFEEFSNKIAGFKSQMQL